MAKTVNELIAEGKVTEAANQVYDNLLYVLNTYCPMMHLSRKEWDAVAPSVVERMQSGAPEAPAEEEKTSAPGDDVTTHPVKQTLKIEFAGPESDEDFKAPGTITRTFKIGDTYKVAVPTVAGYTANKAFVEGTMVAAGVNEKITYTKNS